MSADQPIAPSRAKKFVFPKARGEMWHWLTCTLLEAVWNEKDAAVVACRGRAERIGLSQQRFGWTGDERTLESRCDSWTKVMLLGSTAPIAVLLALSCTLCVNVLQCGWAKTERFSVVRVRLFSASLTLTLISLEGNTQLILTTPGHQFHYWRQKLTWPHSWFPHFSTLPHRNSLSEFFQWIF